MFYRETREARLLVLASAEVHAAIASERKFEATSLFIATWIHVSQRNDLRNKVRKTLDSDFSTFVRTAKNL